MKHGTTNGFWNGCRCLPCRAAHNDYNKARINARRKGDWKGLVPADQVREHLMKFDNLQAVADVLQVKARAWLWKIREGQQTHIRKDSETRILAIDPVTIKQTRMLFMSDGVRVSASSTKNMVRKLRVEGYMVKDIAERARVSKGVLGPQKKRVSAKTEMQVKKFFNRVMAEAA